MTDLEKKTLTFQPISGTLVFKWSFFMNVSLWDASFLNMKAKNSLMRTYENISQNGMRHYDTTSVISERSKLEANKNIDKKWLY